MILLVVGLVAVIVVILIAVFLSIRLGRGDDEDEPDIRPSGRDRRAEEDRWREPGNRDARRPPQAARAARSSGERHGGMDDQRRRSPDPAYGPGNGSRSRPGSGPRDRAAGGPRDRASRGDYDDAPHRPARREAADHGSPPNGRRSAPPAPAQGRRGYDAAPPRRGAADDYPSADYPAMDYPSDEYAAAGYHDDDDRSRDGAPAGRPDPRRKAASPPAAGKSRSKPRGKREDDDDWPSGEWESLSDEQYWAELSADKPLSTSARPAAPARNGKAAAAKPPAGKPAPGERDTRPPRTAAGAGRGARDESPRTSRSPDLAPVARAEGLEPRGRRERQPQREPTTERLPVRSAEPVTERLPVRSPQPPPVPAARRAADAPTASYSVPSGPPPPPDTGLPPARDLGRHPSLDTFPPGDIRPRSARDPSLAMLTEMVNGTPAPAPPPPPIPGALKDDPLTSPSFSLLADPATDSRSYGHSRKSSRPAASGNGQSQPAGDPLAGRGTGAGHQGRHDSGGYAAASYASPGYSYPAEPEPVPAAPAAPAEWYGAPPAEPAQAPAQAPGYGDPYSYPSTGTTAAGSPASLDGDRGYSGYLADPLRVYSPPPYESPAPSYPDPASAPYQAHPAIGMPPAALGQGGHAGHDGYPEPYPAHPYPPEQTQPAPGQPAPGQYPDGYGGTGYAPNYDSGYSNDPYAGGYGGYPSQG